MIPGNLSIYKFYPKILTYIDYFCELKITDAQNECRDKVKFLESLKRPIDQFYHDAMPISCINTALPGLCSAMRTVESVSRYYARHGYLGLLFTKVTNQLVNICKEYLSEIATSVNGEEFFWPAIFKEVEDYDNLQALSESQESFFLNILVIFIADL